MRKNIMNALLYSSQKAKEEMEMIRSEGRLNEKYMYQHLHKYILYKFMLEEEQDTDNLTELADRSISLLSKMDKEIVRHMEQYSSCTSASSAATKKALLYMAIQKELKIVLPANEVSQIESVEELAKYVFKKFT